MKTEQKKRALWRWGGLALLICGGLLVSAALPLSSARAESCWLADRGGNRVVQLDAGLGKQGEILLERPVHLALDPDSGELWVARASEGHALGAFEIRLYRADGTFVLRHSSEPVTHLVATAGLVAWLTFGLGEPASVWVAKTGGGIERLATEVVPRCVSFNASGDKLLVAGTAGELALFSVTTLECLGVGRIDAAQLDDLVPGPLGGWFALDVVGGRVHALDHRLHTRWVCDTGLSPQSLATSSDRQRVWIVDANEPFVRRLSPAGVVELSVPNLPLGGFDRSLATSQGGLLLISPGAVLELDFGGSLVQSQGGFRFLTDIAR